MTGPAAELVGTAAAALAMFTVLAHARRQGDFAHDLCDRAVSAALFGVYGAMFAGAPIVVAKIVNGGFASVTLALKTFDVIGKDRS